MMERILASRLSITSSTILRISSTQNSVDFAPEWPFMLPFLRPLSQSHTIFPSRPKTAVANSLSRSLKHQYAATYTALITASIVMIVGHTP